MRFPQVSQPVEQRSEQEVFYSCPSTSAEAFFEAVTSQLAGLEDSTYAATPSTQLEQAVEIAQAVQASLVPIIQCYTCLYVLYSVIRFFCAQACIALKAKGNVSACKSSVKLHSATSA